MNDNIVFTEGSPRGFASNIICLLGALELYPNSKIWIKKPFLSLYSSNEKSILFDFFDLGPRLGMYSENNPLLNGLNIVDSGSAFLLPSHQEHVESNGEATEQILTRLSLQFSRNFRINKSYLNKFRTTKSSTCSQSYRIAIHRRATDHMMHTNILHSNEFINRVQKKIEKEKCIYIATDDANFPSCLQETNPYIKIIKQESERSSGSVGIHYLQGTSQDRMRRGSEILYDLLMLSRAKTLLCGASGIPFLSRVINPSLQLINIVDQPWY